MLLSAVVLLLAFSKALSYSPIEGYSTKHRPEILLAKWTPRDIYTLEKICQLAEASSYRRTPWTDDIDEVESEFENVFVNKLSTRKNRHEIKRCCFKPTIQEKKQCMKEVRENYLDNYCDKGMDHTCCKTEYESRYTCFTKNPFRRTFPVSDVELSEESWIVSNTPRRMRKERRMMEELAMENMENPMLNELAKEELLENDRFSYVERMEDMREMMRPERRMEELAEEVYEGDRERRRFRDFERSEENVEEAIETAEIINRQMRRNPFRTSEWETVETLDDVSRRCTTPSCRVESEVELENEFMREKMFESEKPCLESHKCRRRLEMATHAAAEQVCANKMFKGGRHQTNKCCRAGALVGKMVGRRNREVCTPASYKFEAKTRGCTNSRHECKNVFVQCCHERAERSREERMVEKDMIRERGIENDLVREEIFGEEPTFYKRTPFL